MEKEVDIVALGELLIDLQKPGIERGREEGRLMSRACENVTE